MDENGPSIAGTSASPTPEQPPTVSNYSLDAILSGDASRGLQDSTSVATAAAGTSDAEKLAEQRTTACETPVTPDSGPRLTSPPRGSFRDPNEVLGLAAAGAAPEIVDGDTGDIAAVFGLLRTPMQQSTSARDAGTPSAAAGASDNRNARAVDELLAFGGGPMPRPRVSTGSDGDGAGGHVDEDVVALDEPSSPLASPPPFATAASPPRAAQGQGNRQPSQQQGAQKAGNQPPSSSSSRRAASSAGGSASPSGSPGASGASGYLRRDDVCHAIQIRADAINETTLPASPTAAAADGAAPKKKPKAPDTELPRELLMPLAQRCDFCIKFDSVCSVCHFKWKGILKQRQATMLAHFKVLPEMKRVAVFFASVARGTLEFVKAMLEANPQGVGWYATFVPPPCDVAAGSGTVAAAAPGSAPSSGAASGAAAGAAGAAVSGGSEYHPLLASSGRVFPLHVAMAYNRVDVAEALMAAGATIRRSENKVLPTDYLLSDAQRSLPDAWEAMLEQQQVYTEHCMSERARTLRNNREFTDAALEYEALLQINPRNEHALCGLVKMEYDQGRLKKCIDECDKLLANPGIVNWIEFQPETVASLRTRAVAEFHARAHAADGPAWVQECGCIDTARTVVRLRRLPMKLIREHILPFADCQTLYQLWRATRSPLLQRATEQTAALSCDATVGVMLSGEFGYPEMYDSIRTDLPRDKASSSIVAAPMQFLGVQVVAMGDFHTFLLRASVVGANPKWKKRFFESDELPKRVVVTKQFRVHRAALGKAWDVHEAGEWEVDDRATLAIAARTPKK